MISTDLQIIEALDGSQTFYLWELERPSDGLQYEQIGGTPYLRVRAR